MNLSERSHLARMNLNSFRPVAGVLLILAGGMLFLDRYLKTGWLSLMILPSVGLFLYLWGIRQRQIGAIIAGALLGSSGVAMMAAWGSALQIGEDGISGIEFSLQLVVWQLGLLSLSLGIGWGIIVITTAAIAPLPARWALVPGGVLGALGYCLLFSSLRWVDFVLYLSLGTGLSLLMWGMMARLIGLVIPGCLLVGIGPGVFMALQNPSAGNALSQTGIFLIGFAVGWFLITLSGRLLTQGFIWWPLIPGGIMAVVGTGLYISGDPSRALGFIGNTGSIALMIFGLYLLLMRKGIHH